MNISFNIVENDNLVIVHFKSEGHSVTKYCGNLMSARQAVESYFAEELDNVLSSIVFKHLRELETKGE